ncbi:MAG: hypothetical protein ACR2ML_06160 [Solirubrobacteraceae bacterium]
MADQDTQPEPAAPSGVWLDGKQWFLEDLTFAERSELRAIVRENLGEPKAEIADVFDEADVIPGLVYLLKRRDEPDYTLDQARQLTPRDLAQPEAKGKDGRPPAGSGATGPSSRRRGTPATSGTQAS